MYLILKKMEYITETFIGFIKPCIAFFRNEDWEKAQELSADIRCALQAWPSVHSASPNVVYPQYVIRHGGLYEELFSPVFKR